MIIEIFIAAATVALFGALVTLFFNALLDFFDWFIKNVKKAVKAIKILRVKNGKVKAGVLTEDKNGKKEITYETETEELDEGDLPDYLQDEIDKAPMMKNGEKLVSPKLTKEAENEIRRRCR